MKKQDVIAEIREQVTENGNDPDYGADFSKLEAAGFKIEVEETEGGEGQGERYHTVLKVTGKDEEFFVKCDAAYYMSYDGVTWEGGETYEAKKVEVKKEVWQPAK